MAVAVDATGTKGKATVLGTTGISYTGLTIGASLSNGALLVGLAHDITVSSVAVVWDSGGTNQSLTRVGLTSGPSGNEDTEWWAVVNPVSGNKTLKVTWNAVTAEMYIGAQSYTGVDQTGGATSFAHFNGTSGISAAPSIAITSATGNIVVAAIAQDGNLNTVSGTLFWAIDNTGPNIGVGMFRSAGVASVTMSGSIGGTANWSISGVDIVAAGGAVSLPFNQVYWGKASSVPHAPIDLSVSLNPNTFRNPVPVFNGDESFGASKVVPDWAPLLPPPLNINLFKNPVPTLNIDASKPYQLRNTASYLVYNQNLYTVTTVAVPFNQTYWFMARGIAHVSLPDAPYNQALLSPAPILMGQIWT